MNILDKIIATKKEEVTVLKRGLSLSDYMNSPHFSRPSYSLKEKLNRQNNVNIIAEFKRRSPSKKQIANQDFKVAHIAKDYELNGAAGISVLTDNIFFGGSNKDLIHARENTNLPLLRKDFVIDIYQIYEARSIGADVILLIAAVLDHIQIKEFTACAHELGLEVLCEVHGQDEIEKLVSDIDIIGVNNRNLKDFSVDFNHSIKMRKLLPEEATVISESGISDTQTIKKLLTNRFNGFLIGESFMKELTPGSALKNFITGSMKSSHDS